MPTVANVQSRIAGLADGQQVISGVAIGAGDVTRGLSGDRKVWQADHLQQAADSLEGTPVKALHSQAEVGEVVRAGYDDGRDALVYEAKLEDAKLADRVATGGLEVSIEARHADGGTVETEQGEAMAATDIRFTGLALVQHGAAPSATASPGEQAALSAADIRETLDRTALADVNGETVDLTPPGAVVNAAAAALEAKRERFPNALGDCGTGVGEDRAEAIVNGELTPADFTTGGDHETAIPDYLNSHSDDVEGIDDPPTQWDEETWTEGCGPVQYALWGGTATGTGLDWAESTAEDVEAAMVDSENGSHQQEADMAKGDTGDSTMERAQALITTLTDAGMDQADIAAEVDRDPSTISAIVTGDIENPPASLIDALKAIDVPESAAATDTDDPVSPERGQGEVSPGGEPAGRTDDQTTTTDSTMSDNPDDLPEEVEELRARLSEKDDRIAELEQTVEQLEAERADVARAYAEALAAGDTIFDEDDLVENFTVAELRAKYDQTDDATLVDPEPDVQSGGGESGGEAATLSDSESAEVAEHREVIADLAGSDTTIAQKERERRAELVADITGEDPDTILDQES